MLCVKNGMIISDGYNDAPTGFDNQCEDENNYTSGMYFMRKPMQ